VRVAYRIKTHHSWTTWFWPANRSDAGGERILKGKSPGSCGEGFEGDVVAEGLGLGNGPARFSSLVAAPGHGGLIRKSTVSRHAAASGRSPDPIDVVPVAR
jgi:hypothetical protein